MSDKFTQGSNRAFRVNLATEFRSVATDFVNLRGDFEDVRPFNKQPGKLLVRP